MFLCFLKERTVPLMFIYEWIMNILSRILSIQSKNKNQSTEWEDTQNLFFHWPDQGVLETPEKNTFFLKEKLKQYKEPVAKEPIY